MPTAPWPLAVVEAVETVNIARVPEALVEVAKVKALARSFFRVEVAWLVKFKRPALMVRESEEASPIWRFPKKPALETKVELAVTVRRSVEVSPRKIEPEAPRFCREVEAVTERAPVNWVSPATWRLVFVLVAMPMPSPPRIVASSAIDKSPAPMMESPTPFRVRPVWKVVVAVTVN